MHIGALTRSIRLHCDTWVSQHANMLLPDWPPVLGEPELEVMRPTEDAIRLLQMLVAIGTYFICFKRLFASVASMSYDARKMQKKYVLSTYL